MHRPSRTCTDLKQYQSDVDGYHRWQQLSIVGTLATITAGSITGLMWFRHQRKSEFSVQPEDDGGASVSYARSF